MYLLLRKFTKLPLRRKLILVEALGNTSVAWFMINFVPYSIWKRWLGSPVSLTDISLEAPPPPAGSEDLKNIAWVHALLSRRMGKHFTCLMLGFSARAMLRRRGHRSLLVLGVGKTKEEAEKRLGAHAWIIHNGYDIVGGSVRKDYTPVAAFGDWMKSDASCNAVMPTKA